MVPGMFDQRDGKQQRTTGKDVAIGLAFGVILLVLVLGLVTISHRWSVGLMAVGAGFIVEAGLRARRRRANSG